MYKNICWSFFLKHTQIQCQMHLVMTISVKYATVLNTACIFKWITEPHKALYCPNFLIFLSTFVWDFTFIYIIILFLLKKFLLMHPPFFVTCSIWMKNSTWIQHFSCVWRKKMCIIHNCCAKSPVQDRLYDSWTLFSHNRQKLLHRKTFCLFRDQEKKNPDV